MKINQIAIIIGCIAIITALLINFFSPTTTDLGEITNDLKFIKLLLIAILCFITGYHITK